MDTAKTQHVSLESTKKNSLLTRFWSRARLLRPSGLQAKLILPYLVLTMALAFLGLYVTTALLVSSERERFHNNMLEASRVANDGIVNQEKLQLDRMRFGIFTKGMAQAIYERDGDTIFTLMRPQVLNSRIDLVTALDNDGHEIVTFGRDSTTKDFRRQSGLDFSNVSVVRKVLDQQKDNQGDKFAQLITLNQGPILFTSAPVVDSEGQRVGVMLVGTYLNTLLDEIKQQALAEVVAVDLKGELIYSTIREQDVTGFDNLVNIARQLKVSPNAKEEKIVPQNLKLNNRDYQVAFSPLLIRGEQAGWIGVVRNSQYLANYATTSRNLVMWVFVFGTLAVIIIGYFIAQLIARPIFRLRTMTQAVAAGDLTIHSGLRQQDEIGELAQAFDTMTVQLRERTEEAERLYQESLQRNKELAEINARLEATQLQLIQSEKLAAIGQLTAGIVHDVKNPFAVIMGMAEVLGEDEALDEATRHGLKVIRESAIKGNTIVSDLLKFARQSRPEMRTMDMRETVQTAMRLTAYLTRKYNTVTDLPDQPIMVTYDAQQIEQVLINMIHNAIQAMPNKGSLRIGLRQLDGSAQISVQDTGSGIPPEMLSRIFDPFFTTKPEGEGTGLGLSVSYGIIANHRGRIDVESEQGVGTTFIINLPITQPSVFEGETNS